jgi:hypothetical protein
MIFLTREKRQPLTFALALCRWSKGICVVGILLNFSTLAVGEQNLRPSLQ